MTITKEELEAQFPGIKISGELNPDISDAKWLFTAGLAHQIAMCGNSKKDNTRELFVYLLQQENTKVFKVGITSNIKTRSATLQQNNPAKLQVLKCVKSRNAEIIEQEILRQLASFSIRGEWVECEKAVVLKVFNRVVYLYQTDVA